jgi:hypothetical protein
MRLPPTPAQAQARLSKGATRSASRRRNGRRLRDARPRVAQLAAARRSSPWSALPWSGQRSSAPMGWCARSVRRGRRGLWAAHRSQARVASTMERPAACQWAFWKLWRSRSAYAVEGAQKEGSASRREALERPDRALGEGWGDERGVSRRCAIRWCVAVAGAVVPGLRACLGPLLRPRPTPRPGSSGRRGTRGRTARRTLPKNLGSAFDSGTPAGNTGGRDIDPFARKVNPSAHPPGRRPEADPAWGCHGATSGLGVWGRHGAATWATTGR